MLCETYLVESNAMAQTLRACRSVFPSLFSVCSPMRTMKVRTCHLKTPMKQLDHLSSSGTKSRRILKRARTPSQARRLLEGVFSQQARVACQYTIGLPLNRQVQLFLMVLYSETIVSLRKSFIEGKQRQILHRAS